MSELLKRCACCGENKEFEEFGANRRTTDGKNSYCKVCVREKDRQRRADPEVRAANAAAARERRKRPEVKARIKMYDAQRRREHPDKIRKIVQSEGFRQSQLKYAASEKGKRSRQAANTNRKAVERNAPGRITGQDWTAILERFQNRCAYCLSTSRLSADHLIPLSRGGSNTVENIVPACMPCNQSKNRYDLLFAATRLRAFL